MNTYCVVHIDDVTEQSLLDTNTRLNTCRYSYQVDGNGDLILANGNPIAGFKIILDWDGETPASIQSLIGAGKTAEKTYQEILEIIETPEWAGMEDSQV